MSSSQATVERGDPSARPRRPEPRPGSAPPTPSSRTSTTAAPLRRRTRDRRLARVGVLGHVGQRLGDDEVGGRLDRRRQPLVRHLGELDRHRRAAGERLERAPEAAVGQHRGVDAARQLAQLLERGLQLLLRGRRAGAPRRSGSRASLLSARRRLSESATSRCWAPSCRLRSSRRRSASPASTIRAREARSSSTRARSSALSRSFSTRQRRPRRRPSATARARRAAMASWMMAPTRWPSTLDARSRRAPGRRRRAARPGGPSRIDPAAAVVEPVDQLQRAVAQRVGQQRRAARRCPGASPRRAQQVGHRAGAREADAQQPERGMRTGRPEASRSAPAERRR